MQEKHDQQSLIEALQMRHSKIFRTFIVYSFFSFLVKPKIKTLDVDKTLVLKPETGLKLTCKIDQANPEATIKWTYSDTGEQWNSINQEQGNVQDNGETLLLKSQKSFEARYKCVARNKLGTDQLEWNVTKASGNLQVYFLYLLKC